MTFSLLMKSSLLRSAMHKDHPWECLCQWLPRALSSQLIILYEIESPWHSWDFKVVKGSSSVALEVPFFFRNQRFVLVKCKLASTPMKSMAKLQLVWKRTLSSPAIPAATFLLWCNTANRCIKFAEDMILTLSLSKN